MTGFLTLVDFSAQGGTVQVWAGRDGHSKTSIQSFDPKNFPGGRGEARRLAVARGKELADLLGVEWRAQSDD